MTGYRKWTPPTITFEVTRHLLAHSQLKTGKYILNDVLIMLSHFKLIKRSYLEKGCL